MNDILIVTGTCGVGKSTVARRWAERRLGAAIGCDEIRNWIRSPVLITADGFQEMLLAHHAALVANSFLTLGLDVAIDNVWTPEGLDALQHALGDRARVRAIWLTATPAENHRRDGLRPPSDVMGARVDELQAELDALDWPDWVIRLDTTDQTVERTLEAVERAFGSYRATLPSGLSLRPASGADAEFIYDVLRVTLADYLPYVQESLSLTDDQLREALRADVDIGQDQIIALHGRDIGVLSVERGENGSFVDKVLILPDYQRWGIGTHLMRAVLDEAFGENLPVRLHVLKVNPARRLYERLGFTVTEETGTAYVMMATPPAVAEGSSHSSL
jgi:GNAT superfamily N-acetyltransferase